MNTAELYDIAKDAINDAELSSRDIPTIDLYVDQILNLMSERIEQGSPRYKDRQLTKTMINNYSKDGLITPIKGKKYNKEQILQMMTVYSLKSTFSIGEIKRLLQGAYAVEGFDGKKLTDLYDDHLNIKEANRARSIKLLDELLVSNDIDLEDDVDYITLIFALASLSSHLRHIAQAMIDGHFPEQSAEEDEKAEKLEKKKAEKAEKEEKKEKKKEEKKQAEK